MSRNRWLEDIRSTLAPPEAPRRQRRRHSLRAATHRLNVETLEVRTLLSFTAPVSYAAGSIPTAVISADFNSDGRLDLAVGNVGSGDVSVLLGNGNGTFQPAQNYAVGAPAVSLAVGDLNSDGKLDIVAADGYGPYGEVSVLLGNGNGTFQQYQPLATGGSGALDVAVGDFNSDGKMDLAVTGFNPATPGYWGYYGYYPGTPATSEVTVLLGHGDLTFNVAYQSDLGGDQAPDITSGDLNGDGTPDIAWADQDGGAVGVLFCNGVGDFAATQESLPVAGGPRSVSMADLNGDGKADLVTANGNDTVRALLGNGDGSFLATQNSTTVRFPYAMAVADFNGDGKPDLVTANNDGTAGVLLGKGDGSFRSPQFYPAGSTPVAAAAGDFNGDGRPDLAVADYQSGVSVLLNSGDWRLFQVSGFPSPTTAGQAQTFTVAVVDDNGNPSPSYTGTVHFTSTDAQAGLPADYTFAAADQGVHTFSATLKTAGSQAISIRDTTTGITGLESGITVTAAAASTMIVSGFPSTVSAGLFNIVNVILEDPYGNIASSYRGTIQFTSSDAKSVLPANYTFTGADAGVHTFSAALKTAGTQSITAADIATSSLRGTDAGIIVNPAAASQFFIVAPSNVSTGVAFSLTVMVEDAYGNVVTGYTGKVHFSSTDRHAKLPADYTFTAADKGVHIFAGVTLQQTGKQTIRITDALASLSGSVIVNVLPHGKK